jgi:hypothetical protein
MPAPMSPQAAAMSAREKRGIRNGANLERDRLGDGIDRGRGAA